MNAAKKSRAGKPQTELKKDGAIRLGLDHGQLTLTT